MKYLSVVVLINLLAVLPVLLSKVFLLIQVGNLVGAFNLSFFAVLIWGLSVMIWKAL